MMNSSITEQEDYDYEESSIFAGAGCGCFRHCWRRSESVERRRLVEKDEELNVETWVSEKLRKLKERSEIVAGPKWKNFIRRFGKYWKNDKGKTTAFCYDAEDYALNFENSEDCDEDERLKVGFSSRFAPPFAAEVKNTRDT